MYCPNVADYERQRRISKPCWPKSLVSEQVCRELLAKEAGAEATVVKTRLAVDVNVKQCGSSMHKPIDPISRLASGPVSPISRPWPDWRDDAGDRAGLYRDPTCTAGK